MGHSHFCVSVPIVMRAVPSKHWRCKQLAERQGSCMGIPVSGHLRLKLMEVVVMPTSESSRNAWMIFFSVSSRGEDGSLLMRAWMSNRTTSTQTLQKQPELSPRDCET